MDITHVRTSQKPNEDYFGTFSNAYIASFEIRTKERKFSKLGHFSDVAPIQPKRGVPIPSQMDLKMVN